MGYNMPMSGRGFTLIELVVCIAIFAMMTALVVAKYGNFNQSVLLTDLAYDVAVTIRTAQTFGLSVQSTQTGTNPFNYSYGVDFCASASGCSAGSIQIANNQIVLFTDTNGNGTYDQTDSQQSIYTLTRGAVISGFCFTDSCTAPLVGATRLDVVFKRPNPDAVMNRYRGSWASAGNYAGIIITGTDKSTRTIIVRSTGQVSVQ